MFARLLTNMRMSIKKSAPVFGKCALVFQKDCTCLLQVCAYLLTNLRLFLPVCVCLSKRLHLSVAIVRLIMSVNMLVSGRKQSALVYLSVASVLMPVY
jgi:hypothetical protein